MTTDLQTEAEAGDAEAQFRYAQALQYGLGIPMDDDLSMQWYKASAEQGFERACFSLGEICKEGRIIPQDLMQAYIWYRSVADGGGELAAAGVEGCEEVLPYLTPEQVSQAHEKAAILQGLTT
jgi:TPR repeat protein